MIRLGSVLITAQWDGDKLEVLTNGMVAENIFPILMPKTVMNVLFSIVN